MLTVRLGVHDGSDDVDDNNKHEREAQMEEGELGEPQPRNQKKKLEGKKPKNLMAVLEGAEKKKKTHQNKELLSDLRTCYKVGVPETWDGQQRV